jgi:UDP-glucose 4-epimerase
MHYLITGGCGFIGSHLIELLLAEGHRISVIDNLSTGKRENLSSGVNLKVADIVTPGVFDEFIADIDGCFHLAAVVSVQRSAEEWLMTHQVNQSGTVALFDTLVRHKKKIPVVFASSAAAYGDCSNLPLKETEQCQPLSAYGVDKFACELQAHIATHIHGIPSIGLRFFNVYGPRQDPSSPYSGVISIFANRIKQNLPVTIFGDGEQTRDFIYVGDIARGLLSSMQNLQNKKVSYGIFNLCRGLGTSVKELAELIISITGSKTQITYGPQRVGDIKHSVGSTQSAKNALDFNASVPLKDGLQLTLKSL